MNLYANYAFYYAQVMYVDFPLKQVIAPLIQHKSYLMKYFI